MKRLFTFALLLACLLPCAAADKAIHQLNAGGTAANGDRFPIDRFNGVDWHNFYLTVADLKSQLNVQTTINYETNYYVWSTNYVDQSSYVSNYFFTNVFLDTYMSNFYQTNYYTTNNTWTYEITTNTYWTYTTNLINNYSYPSNFFQTNIFVTDNTVSNFFLTNITYWTTNFTQVTTNVYFYTTNLITTNLYATYINTTNLYTSNLFATNIYTSNTFTTNITAKNIYIYQSIYYTNLSTMAPDFDKGYAAITTNASFTFLLPIHLDATKTQVQTAVVRVDNSAAPTPIAVTLPANVHPVPGSVFWITNSTYFTWSYYSPDQTNCYAVPIY